MQRAKFTNGQVLVPVCVQGDRDATEDDGLLDPAGQMHVVIDHFPCFIAKDGQSTLPKGNPQPLLSSRMQNSHEFYGIVQARQPHGMNRSVTRYDVVVRGTYQAPQCWLQTPELLYDGNAFKELHSGDNSASVARLRGNTILKLNPYIHTNGVIMYKRGTGVKDDANERGYPFCCTRFQAQVIMESEVKRAEEDQEFLVLGQFFSHVTDWHAMQRGIPEIDVGTHSDMCRKRLQPSSAHMSLKRRRNERRTFTAFLRT